MPLANLGIAVGAFVGFLALLLVGGLLAIQVFYANRIYPGVRALGVPVGGMTRDEARAALTDRVAAMSTRSITIGFKELNWTVAGQHLGVRPDVEPVVDEAYRLGRDGSLPARLALQVRLVFDGGHYEVRTPAFDPVVLEAFMQALAGAVDRPVVDGSLALAPEGTVNYVDGKAGRKLQVDPTRARLEEALARPDASYVDLAVEESQPAVSEQDLAAARAQAEALVSSPLLMKFAEGEWQLSPAELVGMSTLAGTQGVRVDRDKVKAWVANKLADEVDQDPENARFSWQGGVVSLLRPSKDGRKLDVDKTVDLIMAQALTDQRTVPLPVAVTKPEVSQDDADKLHIDGAIRVARTSFAGSSPPKQHNITLATQRLNGVVVPPGKLFSFNKEVGSTSLDAGYKLGWGIANAGTDVKTVPSVAGGICQVATTLFHTVFWSGYQLEERNYHLYWITGYTSQGVEGLDATVDEEAGLDMRFINNTDDYLLIQSWVEGGNVVFGLYGTKPDWTVKVQPGERTDVQKASQDQVIEDEPTLPAGQRLAVEGAMDGFKITNTRTVTKAGEEPRILRLTSVYRSSRNVVLVGTGGRAAGPSQVIPNRPTAGGGADSRSTTTPPTNGTTPAAKPSTSSQPNAQPSQPAPAAKPSNTQPSQTAPAPKPANTQPAPASKPIISPLFPNTPPGARPATEPTGGR